MTNRIALTGLVALAGLFIADQEADAASYQHIDTLALRLQSHSAKLYHEFRLHFSRTPEYPHLISDARSLFHCSKHIHELAYRRGSPHLLASDLRTLDNSFHHLEGLVHQIVLDANHGRVQGSLIHVHRLMKQMEGDLHHLRIDIEELTQYRHGGQGVVNYRRGRGNVQVIRSRNYGEVRSGWTRGLNDLHRGRSRIARRIR